MIRFAVKAKGEKDGPPRRPVHEVLGEPESSGSPWGSTYWTTERKCPREHRLKQLGVVKSGPKSDALDLGYLFHHVLEAYYRARQAGADHLNACTVAWDALLPLRDAEDYQEFLDILEPMIVSYFEYCAGDDWIVIAVEEEVVYEGDFKYSARLDLLVFCKKRGGVYVVEHKSAKAITQELTSGYSLDMQVLGQAWLTRTFLDVSEWGEFRGVIVNITTKPTEKARTVKHERVEVAATPLHLAEFVTSMTAWAVVEKTFAMVGWPKAFGNCHGAARYFSQCTYFELCHGRPDLDLDNLDEHELPLLFSLKRTDAEPKG